MQDQFSLSTLKIFYYRYKETAYYPLTIVVVIFLVSIFLFVQLVVPQLSAWFSLQKEIAAVRMRIDTMTKNNQFLVKQGDAAISSQFDLAKTALPFEKDFAGIYDAITTTAAKSGVTLADFGFSVGDIAEVAPGGLASIQVNLSLAANAEDARKFIVALKQSLPLSEVPTWTTNGKTTSITVKFYYRALPQIPIDNTVLLQKLTAEELATLNTIQSWKPVPAPIESDQTIVVSTDSGETTFYDPL